MTEGYDTRFGFVFGALHVERCFSDSDGRVCVNLIVPDGGPQLNVYASPKGRSLRVFDRDGYEWKRSAG